MNRTRMGFHLVVLLLVAIVATGCGQGPPPAGVAPAPEPAALPASAPRGGPVGDPVPLVVESWREHDRSSPVLVLKSVLAGRESKDLPFLARCEAVTAGKRHLDQRDEARAWRYFCMKSIQPFWDKIEEALESGQANFAENGTGATASFEVGGALGRVELQFVKIAEKWYLEMGE